MPAGGEEEVARERGEECGREREGRSEGDGDSVCVRERKQQSSPAPNSLFTAVEREGKKLMTLTREWAKP